MAIRLVHEHRDRGEALGIVLVSDEGRQGLRCEQERRSDIARGGARNRGPVVEQALCAEDEEI
ncbi:hypothetical protein [Streptomyces sp. NBC_00271]|uniref:hypothetical protein n=1 Tax=Streptomyces sp. NBC_00271 TaxID=2975697 RepID=UPI002E2D54D4|nr:hypothetical protein [Streptomyces sp. NBC_00271]